MSRSTSRKQYARYTRPGKEMGDGSCGDPWTVKGFEPDRTEVFDKTWQVVTREEEGVIGRVFTFPDGHMQLVAQTTRRVIGAFNTLTGRMRWIPHTRGRFGTDKLPIHSVGGYRASNLQTKDTPLARMLSGKPARRLKVDVEADYRARGGNPKHRSQFKFPHKPVRAR